MGTRRAATHLELREDVLRVEEPEPACALGDNVPALLFALGVTEQ